jgi:pSer/pThr/pTyr-binding forkhead associated (FHA) protein
VLNAILAKGTLEAILPALVMAVAAIFERRRSQLHPSGGQPIGQSSHRHAEVFAQGGRFWLADLGSTNPTFVNGESVSQRSVPLAPGGVITLGRVEIRFVDW